MRDRLSQTICMIDLEAFVLIGGRSSRLGQDKAFVEVGGVTLVERAARTAENAISGVQVRLVAGSDSQFPFGVVGGLARPVIFDLRPGFGAWSAIHACLAYVKTEWALVLACDYPFVPAEFIVYLAEQTGIDHHAVVPVQKDGRLQPLCAIYRVRPILAEIEGLMDGGARLPPLVEFLDKPTTRLVYPAEYAAVGDPETLFLNINTPDDLTRARTIAESDGAVAE